MTTWHAKGEFTNLPINKVIEEIYEKIRVTWQFFEASDPQGYFFEKAKN